MDDIDKHIIQNIEEIKEKCLEIKPLVVVRCITFNHEKYIRDALEGFVIQKTKFPFVVIVHDDASKDSTPTIIREYSKKYPDLIFPLFEKDNMFTRRRGLVGEIMTQAVETTGSKYVGMCEGDDYWVDPLKLQKQVDFLEANPDYGMCYTSFDIKDERTNTYRKDLFKNEPDNFPSEFKNAEEFLLKQGYVCPPSWVIKASEWRSNLPLSFDGTFVRFIDFLVNSKVKMLPDVTSVYREVAESASHSSDYEKLYKRQKNLLQTQLNLIDYYHLDPSLKSQCIENHYRRYLKSFVVNSKREDVREAKKVIARPNSQERLLFALDSLRLNPLLRVAKKIVRK